MAMKHLFYPAIILPLVLLGFAPINAQETTGDTTTTGETTTETPQLTPIAPSNTYKSWEFGCTLTAPEGWKLSTDAPGALAMVTDPTQQASLSLSANLLAEVIPLSDYRVRMEYDNELNKAGGQDLKNLLDKDKSVPEGGKTYLPREYLKLYEDILNDDSPTAEELAIINAQKLSSDSESCSTGPLQTMATYLYDMVDTSSAKTERLVGIYCLRGNVGYTIFAKAPKESFDSFLPTFKKIIDEIDLRHLTGGRYSVPEPIKIETEKVGLIMGKVLMNGLGMPGVKVKLYRSVTDYKSDTPMEEVTSNSYGECLFMNLNPGSGFLLDAEGESSGTYVRAWQPISKLVVTEGRATMVNIEVVE
jgi:hypothetical protein